MRGYVSCAAVSRQHACRPAEHQPAERERHARSQARDDQRAPDAHLPASVAPHLISRTASATASLRSISPTSLGHSARAAAATPTAGTASATATPAAAACPPRTSRPSVLSRLRSESSREISLRSSPQSRLARGGRGAGDAQAETRNRRHAA